MSTLIDGGSELFKHTLYFILAATLEIWLDTAKKFPDPSNIVLEIANALCRWLRWSCFRLIGAILAIECAFGASFGAITVALLFSQLAFVTSPCRSSMISLGLVFRWSGIAHVYRAGTYRCRECLRTFSLTSTGRALRTVSMTLFSKLMCAN